MRMTSDNGYAGFTVLNDRTGQKVPDVLWVDGITLEVNVAAQPMRVDPISGDVVSHTHAVANVTVDYAAKVIRLTFVSPQADEAKRCDACCQEDTCRRINYCAAYRCNFGEVAKP